MTFMDVNMVIMLSLIIYLICSFIFEILKNISIKFIRLPDKLDINELAVTLSIISAILLSDLFIPRIIG